MWNCKPVVIFQTRLTARAVAKSKAHFSDLLSCFEPERINLFLEPTVSFLISPPQLRSVLCLCVRHSFSSLDTPPLLEFWRVFFQGWTRLSRTNKIRLLFVAFIGLRAYHQITHNSFIINYDCSTILFHFHFNINFFVTSEDKCYLSFKEIACVYDSIWLYWPLVHLSCFSKGVFRSSFIYVDDLLLMAQSRVA